MRSIFKRLFLVFFNFGLCVASYHEQYRVPQASSDGWESYQYNDREYIIQNLPVTWDNAKILCGGHHNGTLAILDTREKAEFLAEALSESKFAIDSLWVGARRESPDDPAGFRWQNGVELRRTLQDVLPDEDGDPGRRYPLWLNRTSVPVSAVGAECAAVERVRHDRPVLLDLPCSLQRPFACERESRQQATVSELKTVRCFTSTELYRIFSGRLDWKQAAAYCLLRNMTLANIATLSCLKKLGMAMLKTRPSIENAWLGARGTLGRWSWVDTGISIFQLPAVSDTSDWPPMRDRSTIKQNGCLAVDRHTSHSPVFMEARCDRKMEFICQQASTPSIGRTAQPPSDDLYYYVLVRQQYYWQHAYDNCLKMNGTLASVDSHEVLVQLLLVMGENKDEPVHHIWISGRLNMTRDVTVDGVALAWYNPTNGRRIPDTSFGPSSGLYMPPWLDEEYSLDSPCLNLDRQDHLAALVYGLPCDTPQYSVCVIEKTSKDAAFADLVTDKYENNL